VTGALLASSKYANIVDLPITEIMASLKGMIDKGRRQLRTGGRNAEDVLNTYTREYYGQMVVVKRIDNTLLHSLGDSSVDLATTRSRVMGRIEHNIDGKGHVNYYIEERLMRAHCATMSYGFEAFKRSMLASTVYTFAISPRKDMLAGTKGPSLFVRAMRFSRKEEVNEGVDAEPALG
jgi:hypothetical protein